MRLETLRGLTNTNTNTTTNTNTNTNTNKSTNTNTNMNREIFSALDRCSMVFLAAHSATIKCNAVLNTTFNWGT